MLEDSTPAEHSFSFGHTVVFFYPCVFLNAVTETKPNTFNLPSICCCFSCFCTQNSTASHFFRFSLFWFSTRNPDQYSKPGTHKSANKKNFSTRFHSKSKLLLYFERFNSHSYFSKRDEKSPYKTPTLQVLPLANKFHHLFISSEKSFWKILLKVCTEKKQKNQSELSSSFMACCCSTI